MCPYDYYTLMRQSKDPKQIRYQLVIAVEKHGFKPAARDFKTTVKTVKKWFHRWRTLGYQGLEELSRRPHYSPKTVSEKEQQQLTALKNKYKRVGAETVKTIEQLPYSPKTIRKYWRKSRKRKKKHVTKNNLREVKKKFAFLQQALEDTKDLDDIPEYWPQMKALNLPQVQYSFRDVTSGLMLLGFAQERSLIHATLFANYTNYHLQRCGADLSHTFRQTDNGSEYIGSWNAQSPSSYTAAVQRVKGQIHTTIFPGAHRMQADIETIHNLIETEFFEIESFSSRADFFHKAYSYQLFFNLTRPNSYKENKTPWQLVQEKAPSLPVEIAKIPVVDLDALLNFYLASAVKYPYHRGYDVFALPFTRSTLALRRKNAPPQKQP